MKRRQLLRLLCTAGAVLALPLHAKKSKYLLKVLQAQCAGCRDCERVCPAAAITFVRGKAVIDIESCNGCSLCYSICSYGAINKCDIEEN